MAELDDRAALRALIENDARNIAYVFANAFTVGWEHARVIADCAKRVQQASLLGDDDLELDAKANLQWALKGWRES